MSIADKIAVMDHARIEQIGGPRELYDTPANRFVAGFLGPVSQLGDRLVRPHDIVISADRVEDGLEAMVARVIHLGFEVRVELTLADGEPVAAQLTRNTSDELELSAGDIVWLRAATTSELAPAQLGEAPSASSQATQPPVSTRSANAA